jgi:aryl-alcohol dehydrogenase-like predicted oxidoreductase
MGEAARLSTKEVKLWIIANWVEPEFRFRQSAWALNFGQPTGKAEAFAIIDCALAAGVNFIDTANIYNQGESERIIGEALIRNNRRDQVVLATKVQGRTGEGPNDQGISRLHILRAVEASLRRLQTDYIDLYQLHRPSLIPQDETLRALDDLVRAGKVRYIGSSTFPAWMIMEGLAISERYGLHRYISEQPPYNLLDRRAENEVIPLCQKHGLAVLPWAPLGAGILSGRYSQTGEVPGDSRAARPGTRMEYRITPRSLAAAAAFVEMARGREMTPTQLALLWIRDQPGVTAPIIGPRTCVQLEEALVVMSRCLDEADRLSLDKLVPPGSAVANFYNTAWWMKEQI